MTSDFFGKWIKKKRKEKGFTIKEFHKKFQGHLKGLGLPAKLQRSYAWFSGLEKYGVARKDLELMNSLLDFFGYKLVLVRSGIQNKDDLSSDEVKEILEICAGEEKEKEKFFEERIEERIENKDW